MEDTFAELIKRERTYRFITRLLSVLFHTTSKFGALAGHPACLRAGEEGHDVSYLLGLSEAVLERGLSLDGGLALAPSAASCLAMAAPIPRELPVTIATLPARRPVDETVLVCVACMVEDMLMLMLWM